MPRYAVRLLSGTRLTGRKMGVRVPLGVPDLNIGIQNVWKSIIFTRFGLNSSEQKSTDKLFGDLLESLNRIPSGKKRSNSDNG